MVLGFCCDLCRRDRFAIDDKIGEKRFHQGYSAAVRVVSSNDAMTADWELLPLDVLRRISNRVINEVKGINRVVYDVSSKPPATIEWE